MHSIQFGNSSEYNGVGILLTPLLYLFYLFMDTKRYFYNLKINL